MEGNMSNFCEGCAYAKTKRKTGCEAFVEKPKKCWNHTTPEVARDREKQIKRYIAAHK
jgi:hypothetical protein